MMTSDFIQFIARWTARLPRVRQAIRDLSGLDPEPLVLPDPVLASIVAHAETWAETAAGNRETLTRAEAVGMATAVGATMGAHAIVQALAVLDEHARQSYQTRIAETDARRIIDPNAPKGRPN